MSGAIRTNGFGMIEAALVDAQTVFSDPDRKHAIRELPAGSIVFLAHIVRTTGELDDHFRSIPAGPSVFVNLDDGTLGHIALETRVFVHWNAQVDATKRAAMRAAPSQEAECVLRCHRGARLTVTGVADEDGSPWLAVRDLHGRSGYIDGDTPLRPGWGGASRWLTRVWIAAFVLINCAIPLLLFGQGVLRLGEEVLEICIRVALIALVALVGGAARYVIARRNSGDLIEGLKHSRQAGELWSG